MIQRVQENKQFQIIIIVKGKVQKKKKKETMGRQKKNMRWKPRMYYGKMERNNISRHELMI